MGHEGMGASALQEQEPSAGEDSSAARRQVARPHEGDAGPRGARAPAGAAATPGEREEASPGRLFVTGLGAAETLPLCHVGAELGLQLSALAEGERPVDDGGFAAVVIGAWTLEQAAGRIRAVGGQGTIAILLVAPRAVLLAASDAGLPFDEALETPPGAQELATKLSSLRRLHAGTSWGGRSPPESARRSSGQHVAVGVASGLSGPLACVRSNLASVTRELLGLTALAGGLRGSERADAPALDEIAGQLRELIFETREEVERLEALVRELGALARVGPGLPLPVELEGALDAAVARLPLLAGRKISVARELLQLPPVLADPCQLGQLLASLIQQVAATATAPGRVLVRGHSVGSTALVELSPGGVSPYPGSLAHAGRAGQRGAASRPGGFALLLSRDAARSLGGELSSEELPGRGMKLTLRLPLAPGAPAP